MAVDQVQGGVAFKGAHDQAYLTRKPQTYLGMAMAIGSLRRDKLTIVAIGFVVVIALLAIGAGAITGAIGVEPNATNPVNQFQQPYLIPYIQWMLGMDPVTAPTLLYESGGVAHWLGTDQLGRDQLARLLYGARISLSIALVAAAIAMVLGVVVGAPPAILAAHRRCLHVVHQHDDLHSRHLFADHHQRHLPAQPMILTLYLGLLGWFGTARFMRGNVLKIRSLDYTLSARAVGATDWRVLFQHVIPNSLPVIIVITAIDVGALILTESILSFLGLGVQPPTPSWGNMLYRANDFVFLRDPVTKDFIGALHLLFWPGILTTLTVLAFYLIGDGLRDALDPMLKNKK